MNKQQEETKRYNSPQLIVLRVRISNLLKEIQFLVQIGVKGLEYKSPKMPHLHKPRNKKDLQSLSVINKRVKNKKRDIY